MLQRRHRGDGCDLASTLCKYDFGKGDLFVLSWEGLMECVRCACVWLGRCGFRGR